MKKLLVLALVAAMAWGCAQPTTKTQQGAMIGTGLGAAAGAGLGQAIGGDTEGTLLGAGIGAVVGGLAGGGIGRYMDNQEKALRQEFATSDAVNVQRNANLLAVTFKSDMLYDVNSATLKPGAYPEIQRVAEVLNQYPQTQIAVSGHTDSTGAEDYNQQLSERRAQNVKDALTQSGVQASRITTVGYGETQPIASNYTPEGRQLNRRVVINIAPPQKGY